MKRLVEFDLGDGTSIWVEAVEPEPEGGTVRAGRLGDMVQKVKAKVTFDETLNLELTLLPFSFTMTPL